jgi:hypothetical protein
MLEGNHAFGCSLGQLTVSAAHAAQFNKNYPRSFVMQALLAAIGELLLTGEFALANDLLVTVERTDQRRGFGSGAGLALLRLLEAAPTMVPAFGMRDALLARACKTCGKSR